MIFHTQSGSCYEVDVEGKRIRRLAGNGAPTARVGQDGDWRDYEAISPVQEGYSVIIQWPYGTPLLPDTEPCDIVVPLTATSPVARVSNELN